MLSKQKKTEEKPYNAYVKYSGLGFQMAAIIGGGCYLGYKLDGLYCTTNSIFTIIFSLISIALAMYIVLKDFIKPK